MRENWKTKKLKEVAEYFIGLTYSPKDVANEGIVVLRSSNIQGDSLDFKDIVRVSKSVKASLKVRPGDILMCSRNGSKRLVGKTATITGLSEEMTFGTFMMIIRSEFNPYLSWFFKSDEFRSQLTGGENPMINQITRYMLDEVDVPVPPIEEQRRIIAILDEAFAAIDKAKQNTEKNLRNARELFDSYLNNIFSNPGPDWEVRPLKELSAEMTTGPFGSNLHKSDYVSNGIPVVNPQNIRNGEIVPLGKTMVSEETRRRLSKYILREDDIILARRGEMGRCGIIAAEQAGWLCGSGSFLLRVNGSLHPQYARVFLSSETVKKYLLKSSVGTTMDNLNQSVLAALPVPVPPKDEQIRILLGFREVKTRVSAIELVMQAKLARFEDLRKSVLQKAFAGELSTS